MDWGDETSNLRQIAEMFSLVVHTVDEKQPLSPEWTPDFELSPNFAQLRGAVHLFRTIARHHHHHHHATTSSPTPTPNPNPNPTLLFVVAVPNYLSSFDLIRFFTSHLHHISHLLLIRNDAMEDRYSVLISFADQLKADEFYASFDGRRFSHTETEVCHILPLQSVQYTDNDKAAASSPEGCTELPTCPVCLERLDQDTSGIQTALCDHSFQCSCISKWTHLSCQVCRFCQQQDDKPSCVDCKTTEDLWVCVICGFVGCGRYKEGHAFRHWKETEHCYSLHLETQRVWDYAGDTYVHRLNQSKTDGKWTGKNLCCTSNEGDCGNCGFQEDSGYSGVLHSSKVEAIVDEYNRLLATQLETQRQHYETLILEAKCKRESIVLEAVEKAVSSKSQDIHSQLEKCFREKKAVGDMNQELIKNQENMRTQVKGMEEREMLSLKLKDEQIIDLEEQIRDLTVYIEAQKTIGSISQSDDIKGGTVLPVPNKDVSASRNKKLNKSNRWRT
uniref:BRCA1-associated protein n=1 Tax=Kalanchoe fedtschenkoi TaxID=63787 RepID=A0A7N0VJQ6_KALFE